METHGEVLIADGDPSIRHLLAMIVRRLPRRPVDAGDGRSALALLQTHSFDAVILELILPEIAGTDVLAYLEREQPEMLPRVIVVTTVAARQWSACTPMHAVGAVLPKPFAVDDLQRALHRCCDGPVRVY